MAERSFCDTTGKEVFFDWTPEGPQAFSSKGWDPIRGPEESDLYRWCRKNRSTTGYKQQSLPGFFHTFITVAAPVA